MTASTAAASPPGAQARPAPCALVPAAHARADPRHAVCGELPLPPLRVPVVLIATVNNDIALGPQAVLDEHANHFVGGMAMRDGEEQNLALRAEAADEGR